MLTKISLCEVRTLFYL